jgi:hypothetical protein
MGALFRGVRCIHTPAHYYDKYYDYDYDYDHLFVRLTLVATGARSTTRSE